MARLLWGIIPVEKVAAFWFHNPGSKTSNIIYNLKYFNHRQIGIDMGKLLVNDPDFDHFFDDIDALIPMPIAKRRQRERGYNQCWYIAEGISQATGIEIVNDAVERVSFDGSQTQKTYFERQENVKNVFRLSRPERIAEKHIMIVDDVMTTGATIISLAEELLKANGVKISIVTLALAKH